jgi:hypothetical protein
MRRNWLTDPDGEPSMLQTAAIWAAGVWKALTGLSWYHYAIVGAFLFGMRSGCSCERHLHPHHHAAAAE